jgi:hypothetical protein
MAGPGNIPMAYKALFLRSLISYVKVLIQKQQVVFDNKSQGGIKS